MLDGLSTIQRFLKIEIPLILPAIIKSAILVFIFCFTSFAIILGIGGYRFQNLEIAIAYELHATLNIERSLVYAIIQLLIIIFVILLMPKNYYEFDDSIKYHKKEKISIVFQIITILYLIFEYSVVLNGLTSLFYNNVSKKIDLMPLFKLFSKDFNKNYPVILSIVNSLIISSIGSIVGVIISYRLISYKNRKFNNLVMSVMGISSVFLALCLLYLNITFKINYIILIIVGYILISVPISYSFLENYILTFDKNLKDAAYCDGASYLKYLIFIEIPILFPYIIWTFLQSFAILYGEFTICYILQIESYLPLASIVNYSLETCRMRLESSAFSGVNVLVIISIIMIANLFIKKYENS